MRTKLAFAAACCLLATNSLAAEFTVRGSGSAPVKGKDPQTIRTIATREAKRSAVIVAVDKMLGAGASSNPQVAARLDAIAAQIGDDAIVDSKAQTAEGAFQVDLALSLDDRAFRELLSDQGVALNTQTARAYSILAVMDEYRTTPKDLRAPVEELVEFNTRKGSSYSDTSSAGNSSHSSSAQAARSFSSIDASSAQASSASGRYSESAKGRSNARAAGSGSSSFNAAGGGRDGTGSVGASQQAQFSGSRSGSFNTSANGQFAAEGASASRVKGLDVSSSASARSNGASSYAKTNIQAEDHDDLSYRKLVKYQPQATAPETMNRTYGALVGQLQAYDLRVLDNDVFRSRYFQAQPLTLERMTNSGELDRYVRYAKTDASADFFMAGTVVIVDSGVNPTTGEYACSGVVTVKAYATADSETIASETRSAYGSGSNSDACASDVATKMARAIGSDLGAQIQTYWTRRSMYGRELVLRLTGPFLSLPVRARFSQAVAGLAGVESSVQRASGSTEVEITVSYKGSEPIDQAIAMALANDPTFANLDSRTDGQRVQLCLGPCKPGV